MIYTAETQPDTSKTKQLVETAEMKILKKVGGNTFMDKKRGDITRQMRKMDSINDCVLKRKQ